jgi:hypothetical protein
MVRGWNLNPAENGEVSRVPFFAESLFIMLFSIVSGRLYKRQTLLPSVA